ncbi:MAG: DNA gyrase inhibitor YacG [Pararhodobacter sp.]|nr:DNA gyrase inhibitor YacG [Pararhodobacter sp.]
MSAKPASPGACPQCGKPTIRDYRPFCSRRCADVDLARWFREDYVIPGPAAPIDDDILPRGEDD